MSGKKKRAAQSSEQGTKYVVPKEDARPVSMLHRGGRT